MILTKIFMPARLKFLAIVAVLPFLALSCDFLGQSISAGVLRSANGGADWQSSNKINNSKSATLADSSIAELSFDPTNANHLFAATLDNGLFDSTDGGNSWNQILASFIVYDVAIDPVNFQIIYAAGTAADHGRVLATHDGGKSWTEVFNEASTGNAVRGVTLNPANGQELIIGLENGNLLKSLDGGSSWQLVTNFQDRINQTIWDYSGIYVLIRNKGVMKSTDGGSSFQNLTSPLRNNQGQGILGYGQNVGNYNQMAFSPANPSAFYVTADGGLYKTSDGGSTWERLRLPVRQDNIITRAASVSRSNESLVYASAGPTIYKSTDGGSSWQTQDAHTTGQISSILIHPQNPSLVYAGIYAK